MTAPDRSDGAFGDLARVNYRRALVLMTMGALIGLLLAGFTLFTAKGTSTLIVPPEDVALVNQQPISRSDYEAQLRAMFDVDSSKATPAQRRQVLQGMIREELFVQRGKELDVSGNDPEVRGAMVNAVEQQAAADAIASSPSEAQLRAYYATHQDRYSSEGTMTVRDMLYPSMVAAIQRSGGRGSGLANGEEFYFAAEIHLGHRLFSVARSLSDGAISAPVVQPDGVHVLEMIRNQRPIPLDFAEAREGVLTDYRAERSRRLLTGAESFLRKRTNILIAKDMRG